jgi:hypothetical protein
VNGYWLPQLGSAITLHPVRGGLDRPYCFQ